ncbi:MAG: hypothetical protein COA99_09235 [Moraxellaceae bacterium]|nr:MAG: hypothetical protein COA99_09235 [Moraxellaceae bacterium]
MEQFLSHPDFYKYLSIPITAAFVGWGTNWLAIKLMFYPIEFVGFKSLKIGWQGVVPAKAEKMAKIVVEKGVTALASLSEVYGQLDQNNLKMLFGLIMNAKLDGFIDNLMEEEYGEAWGKLSSEEQGKIKSTVREQLPVLIDQMVDDVGGSIEELIDLEEMVCIQLVQDRELLNRMFLEAGKSEFKFIVNSGIYFGTLFGIVQMIVWSIFPEWWVLPLFGLLVGYATNAIALNVIFRPVDPIKIGPFVLHGLFLRRQKEVAKIFCRIITQDIFTIRNLMTSMLNGSLSYRTRKLMNKHIEKAIDEAAGGSFGISKAMAEETLGEKGLEHLKLTVTDKTWNSASVGLLKEQGFNEGQSEVVELMLRDRMEALSSSKFQEVLRPAFQEDEWILISVGALLGLCSGFLQLFFVFGGI